MLQKITKTVGSAMAALCLVSTLAVAQTGPTPTGQSTTLTCTKDDGKGMCTVAVAADGKEVVVVGAGSKKGDSMQCVNMATVINCTPVKK